MSSIFRAIMSSSYFSGFGQPSFNKQPMRFNFGQRFSSRKPSEDTVSSELTSPTSAETNATFSSQSFDSGSRNYNAFEKPKQSRTRPSSTNSSQVWTPNALTRRSLMNNPACPVLSPSTSMACNSANPLVLNRKQSCAESLRSVKNRDNTAQTSNGFLPSLSNFNVNWFRRDQKAEIDPLLKDEDRADTLQEERERIHKKYRSPQHPIVFCHGLLGFDSIQLGAPFAALQLQVSYWRGIKEVLEANGTEVLITRVPATSSIPTRAKVLLEQISKVYSGREVHLLAHSMGGLDCRYLATHLEKPFKVLSITTIATPHRGSVFADHFINTIGQRRIPSFVSLLDLLPNGGGDGQAFESLTVENMRRFNEETPDVPGVKYFSWGATYEPGLIDTWRYSHAVVLATEGLNDGLVSVKSSKWGTYLGTLENVSHLELVGWISTARYKWAEFTGRKIEFKPATFYLGIADHLARVVEKQDDESGAVIRNEDIGGVDTSPILKSR